MEFQSRLTVLRSLKKRRAMLRHKHLAGDFR